MKKIWSTRFLCIIATLAVCTAIGAAPKKRTEVYIPMDYSTCGYHASEVDIPNVKNVLYITPDTGDSYAKLQCAIDFLTTQPTDANGHRGAILLGEGTFYIDQPLRIGNSGIVIRGSGRDKTIIVKRGVERGAAIYISEEGRVQSEKGSARQSRSDTLAITDTKVMAGATAIPVKSTANLKVGDRIKVVRPCTWEWIEALNCRDFGGQLDFTGWKPTDMDIAWDRTITEIANDKSCIELDAPITATLDPKYGGGYILTNHQPAEVTECGVENLTLMSEHNDWNPMDEDHCWDGVWVDNARDCWVRRVNFKHFAGSAVNIQKNVSRMTVEDCVASEPVSEIGGWRRSVFLTRGQQTLFQRCVSKNGIHDFATAYCAAGPNAFVQCEAIEALGFSGSIGSWATGLLFDIVDIDGSDLVFKNLEQFQFGTGWNTANSMFWQCTASTIHCYSPDADNRSSAHGCWGILTGNGEWTSSNDHVNPRSLFYSQLQKRMGDRAIDGHILPRNTKATSSPEIDAAQILAHESLTQPRLTTEMWIDSIISEEGKVKREEFYSVTEDKKLNKQYAKFQKEWSARHLNSSLFTLHSSLKKGSSLNSYAVNNGHLTFNGKLITGNRHHIPWWNGRIKDNFLPKSKPAITRFVPGREGMGLTDRIDSVVNFMVERGNCILDHNYGLWYDLRRSDHERIRRADADVWAPFYEMPFSRTGKGKSWEGTSRYDLTKPNQWYWHRLREYADKGSEHGLLLFHQNYFQHNILEAGAHWVDSPWRPTNNVNGTDFPEPVPFTGDKRIFMAAQFYDITNPINTPLHKQYIRMCLEQLKDQPNAVQFISEEYTGPLHFTRFWLETIAEWQAETGNNPLIALSCTKDVQDAILADPVLSKVVDIIDIRYWHYKEDGIYAPEGGKNMAPRQFMRKMKVGKTGFAEAYKAVKEYTTQHPDKAVTFFAQQYPAYGWAILMAGGSCPNVKVDNEKFLSDVAKMRYVSGEGDSAYQVLGDNATGYVVYSHTDGDITFNVAPGKYRLHSINTADGTVLSLSKKQTLKENFTIHNVGKNKVWWLEKL